MINRVLYKYKHKLPDYSKPLSAGIDLRADIDEIIEQHLIQGKIVERLVLTEK